MGISPGAQHKFLGARIVSAGTSGGTGLSPTWHAAAPSASAIFDVHSLCRLSGLALEDIASSPDEDLLELFAEYGIKVKANLQSVL
jgi:hypothetical protein